MAQTVTQCPGGWEVTVARADGDARIAARAVILAVPPRMLARDLSFDPALEPEVVRALRQIPTWMAGHAKALLVFDTPFWRALGLSGDAISHRGPMVQIHDASPADGAVGALFGFIGLTAGQRGRLDASALNAAIARQAIGLFGPTAADARSVIVQDWAHEPFTATDADHTPPPDHPAYGMPDTLRALAPQGLIVASTEVADLDGGLLEGALVAAEAAAHRAMARARAA